MRKPYQHDLFFYEKQLTGHCICMWLKAWLEAKNEGRAVVLL